MRETNTPFLHVDPRTIPASLSGFLTGSTPNIDDSPDPFQVPDPAKAGQIREFNDLRDRRQKLAAFASANCIRSLLVPRQPREFPRERPIDPRFNPISDPRRMTHLVRRPNRQRQARRYPILRGQDSTAHRPAVHRGRTRPAGGPICPGSSVPLANAGPTSRPTTSAWIPSPSAGVTSSGHRRSQSEGWKPSRQPRLREGLRFPRRNRTAPLVFGVGTGREPVPERLLNGDKKQPRQGIGGESGSGRAHGASPSPSFLWRRRNDTLAQ